MQNSRCWEMAAYILKPSTHVIRCWEMARYMQQCACHVVGKWPFACPRRNYIVQSQTRRDDTVTQTRTLRCWEMACLSHVSEQVFRMSPSKSHFYTSPLNTDVGRWPRICTGTRILRCWEMALYVWKWLRIWREHITRANFECASEIVFSAVS
jgi:hypothetical protein